MELDNQRRFFSFEEKEAALRRTYYKCACCGKKLDKHTMTTEHIIPLSKGGTNEPENLIALCEECNKAKGNMLYIPHDIYLSAPSNERAKMTEHFTAWFRENRSILDFEKFPLVSPSIFLICYPMKMRNAQKIPIGRQFMYEWRLVNKESVPEIEAVTGLSIKEIRKELNEKANTNGKLVAVYSLRKVNTDKILALVTIMYDEEREVVISSVPWQCIKSEKLAAFLYEFHFSALCSLVILYDVSTYGIALASEDKELMKSLMFAHMLSPRESRFNYFTL